MLKEFAFWFLGTLVVIILYRAFISKAYNNNPKLLQDNLLTLGVSIVVLALLSIIF